MMHTTKMTTIKNSTAVPLIIYITTICSPKDKWHNHTNVVIGSCQLDENKDIEFCNRNAWDW